MTFDVSTLKFDDVVRYTNRYGQTMIGQVKRVTGDVVVVKRSGWYAEEAIRPADYVTFEVVKQED